MKEYYNGLWCNENDLSIRERSRISSLLSHPTVQSDVPLTKSDLFAIGTHPIISIRQERSVRSVPRLESTTISSVLERKVTVWK
jgi:hypothetical protein